MTFYNFCVVNREKSIIYNEIIHVYLEIELFGDPEIDVGESIECYMSTYLYREQYEKCIEVFKDLYQWTGDEIFHDMDAFHEVALYYFLVEMENLKDDFKEDFENIYEDIDFLQLLHLYKEEKVLIEVKKVSSSYLKAGYEKQLCDYIRYSDCKNAFYLIVCFSDNDYKKANNFIENHVYTDNFQMYINIGLLDIRRKLAASKKH